ncbi:protein SanA, affects membrane permeability for vancomycin [Denitrobacterium detoxificans]|uniref:Protein SanA, affects membrane permeability for vancomycin n=1 Tax=Denitrobacterium detoxificans TaxID=79604 RepID=A0A1H8TWY0_9ACTN|nr:protein SanA, affects membrane permeability for vancomycin [Denitrobacterium detoxificans]
MRLIRFVFKLVFRIVGAIIAVALAVLLVPNAWEYATQVGKLRESDAVEASVQAGTATYDCIFVLGAAVQSDGEPSTILQDRLDVAIALYKAGVAPKIIMSGDDESDSSYDEVMNMKRYAVEAGVPSEDVFCDHAGLNTYDSMYRAKYVFGVSSMVVVTQEYHQYRALFDASSFGMQVVGVSSDLHSYAKQTYFDVREVFARISDMGKVLTNQQATRLSEPVSLSQSGDVTSW